MTLASRFLLFDQVSKRRLPLTINKQADLATLLIPSDGKFYRECCFKLSELREALK